MVTNVYKYFTCEKNILFYEARILFGKLLNQMEKIFILWNFFIHITDSSSYIYGSFNFDSHSDIIKPKQFIALIH